MGGSVDGDGGGHTDREQTNKKTLKKSKNTNDEQKTITKQSRETVKRVKGAIFASCLFIYVVRDRA